MLPRISCLIATTYPGELVLTEPSWGAVRGVPSCGAAGQRDEAVQHPAVAEPQPIVLVLVGHPGPQAADRGGGGQREFPGDVHVVEVDRRRGRRVVGRQPGRVVEPGPRITRRELL